MIAVTYVIYFDLIDMQLLNNVILFRYIACSKYLYLSSCAYFITCYSIYFLSSFH
jgi:hypothetical protein